MAKNQNTFEKHRRDMEKKHRAEEKRKRRQTRKNSAAAQPIRPTLPPAEDDAK